MIDSACRTERAAPVVSAWRKSGNGESSLVRTVYNSCERKYKFHKYAWVHVPQPFETVVFCQSLCSELGSTQGDAAEYSIGKCQELLHQYRCLVVIDGLESENQWDSIRPISPPGISISCIVVVTSQESVARHCATNAASGSTQINDAALLIFKEKVCFCYLLPERILIVHDNYTFGLCKT
ncbi:hypothetical protein BS78_05G206900 [Paspalum vaginatum]|nr:hypothetical protein BS78_05G206900 [Paspalum vaginatum]